MISFIMYVLGADTNQDGKLITKNEFDSTVYKSRYHLVELRNVLFAYFTHEFNE